jgi:hypothetical protein
MALRGMRKISFENRRTLLGPSYSIKTSVQRTGAYVSSPRGQLCVYLRLMGIEPVVG